MLVPSIKFYVKSYGWKHCTVKVWFSKIYDIDPKSYYSIELLFYTFRCLLLTSVGGVCTLNAN